jgi:hypothetical protein
MTVKSFKLVVVIVALALPALALGQESYDGNRWFQIEVSIFSSEYIENENSERWSPARLSLGFPRRLRLLASPYDFLFIENFRERLLGIFIGNTVPDAIPPTPQQQYIDATGPFPAGPAAAFQLPDMERDAFLRLPADQSDFQQTNRALERSPRNRLLFHGVWRQPVMDRNAATAVFIEGGRKYGDRHEMEGSLTLRFNAGRDRVVIDSNVWLVDYSRNKNSTDDWQVPALPTIPGLRPASGGDEIVNTNFFINLIVQLNASRDMRSNEFHYLDHPAMGMVVSIKPYVLPLPVPAESSPAIRDNL